MDNLFDVDMTELKDNSLAEIFQSDGEDGSWDEDGRWDDDDWLEQQAALSAGDY